MAAVKELLRAETDGTLSFGDYTLDSKTKLDGFDFQGDIYKVKTFKEITKLEKNGMFVYESVPGTAVENFKATENVVSFKVCGETDFQFTLGMEADAEYVVYMDDVNISALHHPRGRSDASASGAAAQRLERPARHHRLRVQSGRHPRGKPVSAPPGYLLRLSGTQRHLHRPLRLWRLYGRAGVHELPRGLHEELPGGSPLYAAVPQPESRYLLRSGRLGTAGHHMAAQAHL